MPGFTMVESVRFHCGFQVGGGHGMLVFVRHEPGCAAANGRIRSSAARQAHEAGIEEL